MMSSLNIHFAFSLILLLSAKALEPFNFLHLTDLHSDPFYLQDGDKSYHCQQKDLGVYTASHFGRYGCDSPKELIDFMLKRAKDTVESLPTPTPFIILSGDLITHYFKSGNKTKTEFEIFQQTSRQIRNIFPNIPALLVPGNNDALQHDQVPTIKKKKIFYGVMFDNFFNQSDAMRQRFSDLEWKELQRTFMDGGYYKYKHNDKLTIISLDTNYWHSSNMKSIDYRAGWRQMYFLQDTLNNLGDKEQAILFGHIFPGIYFKNQHFWNQTYIASFRTIVWKYHDKILGYLSGHTHHGDVRTVKNYDFSYRQGSLNNFINQFRSIWSQKQIHQPYLSIIVAPAISPIYGNNPGIRIFHVDTQRDSEQYYLHSYNDCFLDIYSTIANQATDFRGAMKAWNFCYNSTQFMENLKPQTINAFNNQLFDNQKTLYNWFASKSGFDPQNRERAWDIIVNDYEKNEIINIPKNEWNCQFWCYSQYLFDDEYEACLAKKIKELYNP